MSLSKLQRKFRIVGAALSLVLGFILLSSVTASAQYRDNDRRDNRRNDRRDDRWGQYNKREIENLIRRVEQRTDVFVRQFDRSLDNSRIDGTRREDRLNERARELENATDQLRSRFNRSNSLRESRDEVQRVVRIAGEIDRAISRGRVGSGVQRSWSNLRSEINTLARAYNVRSI
jgi:hypothetical protein